MKILVTGSSGFIGYHLCERLIADGHKVFGIDAMTAYYDPDLKRSRLKRLQRHPSYSFLEASIETEGALEQAMSGEKPDIIVHLAAQPGVRYSLENPKSYVDANLNGSWRVLDYAKSVRPQHLLLASSSSVYGASSKVPFHENDNTDQPLSLYAATKKGMEAIAFAYSHLHQMAITSFRFFTVYGPWGRPDMAIFKFTRSILEGKPIEVYGEGTMSRDFTFVDDLVESIVRLLPAVPSALEGGRAPYRVVNIGGGQPVGLGAFIRVIEDATGKTAIKHHMAPPPGDVPRTYAAPDVLVELTGYKPSTPLETGVAAFVRWYREHYKV